jgi:hypothetical protein
MTTTVLVTIEAVKCGVCQAWHGLEAGFHQKAKQSGAYWYCPHCKSWIGYNETEIKRLRDELAREKHRAEQRQARIESLQRETEHLEHRRRGTLGALRRTQKRVKHGVCPCCNRTFQNLARHMAGKHPHFGAATETDSK